MGLPSASSGVSPWLRPAEATSEVPAQYSAWRFCWACSMAHSCFRDLAVLALL